MKFTKALIIVPILLTTFFVSTGVANAQLSIPGIIGGLLGGAGGGQTVRIIDDVSPNTIANTISTKLMEGFDLITSGQISSLNLKETVLDSIVWQLAQQFQQQITGDLLKWLNGQQPGQDGQVPFVQNYAERYGNIRAGVAGEFIFGSDLSGMCSQEQEFQVRKVAYDAYVRYQNEREGEIFSCPSENSSGQTGTPLERAFLGVVNCDGSNTACSSYKAIRVQAEREANAIANEKQVLDYSRGLLPKRVCRTVNDPDGRPRQLCDIVNPPFLESDIVSFRLAELPGLQMLQMDEINEMVSGFMSSLTDQITRGFGGVLGLGGNSNFLNNIFGPDGALSYADALIRDDIAAYQSGGSNPINEAVTAQQNYVTLQTKVFNKVNEMENQLATAQQNGSCTSLSLPADLARAKVDAAAALDVSDFVLNGDESFQGLIKLNQAYTAATDASTRSGLLSVYTNLKQQGVLRDQSQNQQFEMSFVNYQFSLPAEQFHCELVQCGAAPASSCVINS